MDQLDYNLQQQQQQLMLLKKQLILLLKNYNHPNPNHPPPSNNGEFSMTDIVLTIIILLPVLLLLLQALQLVRFVVKAVYIAMKDQKYHKAYPIIFYWSCQEKDDDDSSSSSSSRIQNLKTEDIDKLASEIAMALRHFCIPESQFAIFQGGIQTQQELFDCIGRIEMFLEKRAAAKTRSSSHDGALLTRFRQHAMYTPRNIQALFHMCDPDIRTGPIQSRAFEYLTRLGSGAVMLPSNSSSSRSIWRLEILAPSHADKHCLTTTAPPSPSASSSFGLQLITVAAKALLACPITIASSSCSSTAAAAWRAIDLALANTVLTVSPCEMMQLLCSIDWPAILQKGDNENGKNHCFVSNQSRTFVKLHQWARRLLAIEPDNATAKTFLQDKLGSCYGLLGPFLCQIIQGQQGVVCCADAADFLLSFGNCLVPQPIDHETVELVCQARDALIGRCLANTHGNDNNNNPKNIPDKNIRSVLDLLERWQVMRYDESDQSRLLQFRIDFMLDADDSSCCLKKDQHAVKKTMKNNQKIGNANMNLTDGEMCANCAILENQCQAAAAGGGLLKCSRCRQIMYCSRKCQVEHWNKGHQNHCERVKYYSFSP